MIAMNNPMMLEIFQRNETLFSENQVLTHMKQRKAFDDAIENVVGFSSMTFLFMLYSLFYFTSLTFFSGLGIACAFLFLIGGLGLGALTGNMVSFSVKKLKWFSFLHKKLKAQEKALLILEQVFKEKESQFIVCHYFETLLQALPKEEQEDREFCSECLTDLQEAFSQCNIRQALIEIHNLIQQYEEHMKIVVQQTDFKEDYQKYKNKITAQEPQEEPIAEKEMEIGRIQSDYDLSKRI